MAPPGLFFIHIMKTGGFSVGDALSGQLPPRAIYPWTAGGEGGAMKGVTKRLLDLDEQRRREVRFFTVHMPAFVADVVASDFLSATVLREPVARTVSHLHQIAHTMPSAGTDIEQIYDDEGWRSRLSNYQTGMFCMRKADHDAEQADMADAPLDDERLAALSDAIAKTLATGVRRPLEMGDEQLRRAVDRLDEMDVVGTTDQLGAFVDRVAGRLGWDVEPVRRLNTAKDPLPISSSLLDRIRADNALDAELFERARERAEQP